MSDSSPLDARHHATEPMDAARQFAWALHSRGLLERTWRLKCELHGGTGRSLHGAVMLGLEGLAPTDADAPATQQQLRRIRDRREVRLLGRRRIAFDARHHLVRTPGVTPLSAGCGIRLWAFDPAGRLLLAQSYQVRVAAAS